MLATLLLIQPHMPQCQGTALAHIYPPPIGTPRSLQRGGPSACTTAACRPRCRTSHLNFQLLGWSLRCPMTHSSSRFPTVCGTTQTSRGYILHPPLINKTGPSTDPRGTPLVIHSQSDDPTRFFYLPSSLQSVTSQLREEDDAGNCFKSPAKANVDDIQGSGSTDLVISSPKVISLQVQPCRQFPVAFPFTCLKTASERTSWLPRRLKWGWLRCSWPPPPRWWESNLTVTPTSSLSPLRMYPKWVLSTRMGWDFSRDSQLDTFPLLVLPLLESCFLDTKPRGHKFWRLTQEGRVLQPYLCPLFLSHLPHLAAGLHSPLHHSCSSESSSCHPWHSLLVSAAELWLS